MIRAPYAIQMHCDHTTFVCMAEVRRAPRIIVPSIDPLADGRRMKIMTTLHYCDAHAWDFKPADYWNDREKARLEARARALGLIDWKPDFEKSYLRMILVTMSEYQAFLMSVGETARAA